MERVVKEEEVSFLRTLSDGLKKIDQIIRKNNGDVDGKQVFELYDTYGFPSDLTALILSEKGLSFNQEDFDIAMQQQKEKIEKDGKLDKRDWIILIEDDEQEFVGYNNLEVDVRITRYRGEI